MTGTATANQPVTTAEPAAAEIQLVEVRHLRFDRGRSRPLPTTVWYPTGKRRALGRLPLLLYSHGLHSDPASHQATALYFAAHGYIVAAPAYPRTRRGTANFSRADIAHQPLDASTVITGLLAPGSPLANRIDADRIVAAGHSAGGTTTNGLLSMHRDARIRAGIVIAGRPAGTYRGASAPILFIHGDRDPIVPYSQGRDAFRAVPWPKAMLTIRGGGHGGGLGEGERGHEHARLTMLAFLSWVLDGDQSARRRLTGDDATTFESTAL
jgi:dipeptidyl aminopeptidase/acylaminoacyl peptidase